MEFKVLEVVEEEERFISPDDILSDRDEALLMAVRDSIRDNYFLIGKIANKYQALNAKAGVPCAMAEIYNAVGRTVGASKRTIRYYADVEKFYPKEVQEEYNVVSFNKFDFARGRENWREILNYCAEHPDHSLAKVRIEFDCGGFEDEVDTHQPPREAIYELAETLKSMNKILLEINKRIEHEGFNAQINQLAMEVSMITSQIAQSV